MRRGLAQLAAKAASDHFFQQTELQHRASRSNGERRATSSTTIVMHHNKKRAPLFYPLSLKHCNLFERQQPPQGGRFCSKVCATALVTRDTSISERNGIGKRYSGAQPSPARRAHEPPTSPCGSDPEPTSHLARTDATAPTAARATHPCAARAATILPPSRRDAAAAVSQPSPSCLAGQRTNTLGPWPKLSILLPLEATTILMEM